MIKEKSRSNNLTFRFLAEPGDVNFGGKVHGAAVMRWLDQAGYACSTGWSGNYCVTVYVGGIHFVRPIQIGEIVQVHAQIIHTGRTSMHIMLDVMSKKTKGGNYKVNTHCMMVFVAVDDDGKPTVVPKWIPATQKEIDAEKFAIRFMDIKEKFEDNLGDFTAMT